MSPIRKLTIFLIFYWVNISFLFSQVETSFTLPLEVCVNEPFNITNTSQNITTSYWNFCGININNPLEGTSISNPDFSNPVFIDIIETDNEYIGFLTNNNGGLVQLNFGNSLLNTPQTNNLGSLNALGTQTEAIQIIKDQDQWKGFIIGGLASVAGEFFLRLDFGTSLNNMPTITNLGNIGNLAYPHDLHIFKENGNWFGWTINRLSSTLTRFSFGNSLDNTPTAENIGNLGDLNSPSGFVPIFQNGNWHIFIANQHNNTLTRLDFGNQLSNIPTSQNLGDLGFQGPRDVLITEICGSFVGVVANKSNNTLTFLDFGSDLLSIPNAFDLGNIGNLDFPHSFSKTYRIDNDIYFFIINVENNTISRMKITGCTNASANSSSLFSPPAISYDMPGTYIIQLITDIGLPTQSSYCNAIQVHPSPELDLGQDTTTCLGTVWSLQNEDSNTVWQNEYEGTSFEITESGLYFAELAYDKCITTDSIFITFEDCNNCVIFPNTFTPDGDNVNDIFRPIVDCPYEVKDYELIIFNRWGQHVFKTKNILSGWDGIHNNKNSSSDVYVWMVNYAYFDGEEIVREKLSGDLTLIR